MFPFKKLCSFFSTKESYAKQNKTVLEKCREYCKRVSTSEEHYLFLLSKVCINPQFRNQECSRPDCLCENCDKNKFALDYFNKMWEWGNKHEIKEIK